MPAIRRREEPKFNELEFVDNLTETISGLFKGEDYYEYEDNPFIPAPGEAEAHNRVMKFDDAMLVLYAFYAHALSRGFATELRGKIKAIKEAGAVFAASAGKTLLKKGLFKTISGVFIFIVQIVQLSAKVKAQKEIADRLRFVGLDHRRQIVSAQLFGGNPRRKDKVKTRHV